MGVSNCAGETTSPGGDGPIECFWADRLEFVPLFPPSPPAGVLEAGAVGNRVLLPGHVPPGTPDIFLTPFVGEVIDLTGGEGCDAGIVWGSSAVGDRDEQEGEII